ncbi:MAG TPA: site-2 protease family protein [Nevskiaceae bacterium]|nr:site-2 protease family protein [Nevskiaceae bacterium]
MSFNPIVFVIAFLLSLSIHEAAHAWMSDRLGDPTARLAGRVTLNPLAHLDPIGTLLPFFLILTGSPIIFGWGKPVPFDPYNLRRPRRDAALISFSGPAVNLLLAITLSILIRVGHLFLGTTAFNIEFFLTPVIALNVMWACFNLLPIHPLDGGKVLIGLLPHDIAYKWDQILNQYGMILLLFLILPLFGTSLVFRILLPIINLLLAILLPGSPLV